MCFLFFETGTDLNQDFYNLSSLCAKVSLCGLRSVAGCSAASLGRVGNQLAWLKPVGVSKYSHSGSDVPNESELVQKHGCTVFAHLYGILEC